MSDGLLIRTAVYKRFTFVFAGIMSVILVACAPPSAPATDIPATTISVFNLSPISVSLTWSTGKPANTDVEYWKSGTSDKKTIRQDSLSTHHQVDVAPLEPGVTYYYRIQSQDADKKIVAQKDSMFLLGNAAVGKSAPDFTLTALSGKKITLNDLKGKPVLLDFWIYTCTGCKEKLKLLQEATVKMAGKAEILCIHPKEREQLIKSFLEADSLSVPVFMDSEMLVVKFYKVTGFPTTFFIDSKGIVRFIDREFSTVDELQDIFDSMASQPGVSSK